MNEVRQLPPKQLFVTGISGAIAVALGALGAHWLRSKLGTDQLSGFETGVRYHLLHTIAMLAVIFLRVHYPGKYFAYAYAFFLWGIVLFSGSIYLLCTRELLNATWLSVLGPVTPIGGLCFIAGWICLTLPVIKKR
jgi:uncharacterized membrane protein YgdD (TMEM256/DUF423 family)